MSRWLLVGLVLLLALTSVQPVAAAVKYPSSITALGDSISTAYDSAGLGNNFAYSWSTGTNTSVNSMYLRILANNRRIRGKNTNLAVSGTKMIDLDGQASKVSRQTEYVTILMGANDICTSNVASMTDPDVFQDQFITAMNTLTKKAPKARIYVVSIPDIYNLWDILHNNSAAIGRWSLFNICQSLLANPQSTAQADIDRRQAVQDRNLELNQRLEYVCTVMYAANCIFDNYAVFNTTYDVSDVSTIDYFHPSVSGQAKLAGIAWNASDLAGP